VGVAAGAYSSIFIAPPLVAMWKEKEPRYAQLKARVERLAAQGPGADRPERPERPERPVRGRRPAAAQRPGARRPEPERLAEPELPPDEELEDEVAESEPAAVVPTPAPAPARRQPPKPRPNQQRRKPSGRQQSRPAKRRRR
jgi:preprotein translocase subunit SecF